MILTDEQKRMYQGEYGPGFQKSINMLIEYGEVWDADRLVKVDSVHSGLNGGDWMKGILDSVDKIRAPATTHCGSAGAYQSRKALGVKEEFLDFMGGEQAEKEMMEYGISKGFILASTCTPYLVGNLPTAGRVFSWPGSSGIIICNSIFGARGNRDAFPASLVSAVTGLTPDMLLLQKEHRYGEVLFKIEDIDMENCSEADYGAIGNYIGGIAETKNTVVEGVPRDVTFDKLKSLLTPQPVSGAVAMCHIVGVTPEAPTVEEALGHKKPEMTVKIGKKELKESWESLHTAKSDDVEVVSFGCPQLGINEIGKIARLLEGKKIASGVKFAVSTAEQTYTLAKRMGFIDIIEKAGGIVVIGICIMGFPYGQLETPATTGATNSAKAASYQARGGTNIQYGSFEDCINAAVTGKWGR